MSVDLKWKFSKVIRLPVTRIYHRDLLDICRLFEEYFGTFKAEIETNHFLYTFTDANYDGIERIKADEQVDGVFINHFDQSAYPTLTLVICVSYASINIADTRLVPRDFPGAVKKVFSRNKRLPDLIYAIGLNRAALFAVASDLAVIWLFGLRGAPVLLLLLATLAFLAVFLMLRSFTDKRYIIFDMGYGRE
ncbi:MAG: hypothetical protein A4E28_02185 [Methanocella sp. PtaU1.Bin125]|nr:MAG: hypothetical protein A4E28_02185 [Methanocella sp. PtaU1.Bin125]